MFSRQRDSGTGLLPGDKLSIMTRVETRTEPSGLLRDEEASQILLNLAPFWTNNGFDHASGTGLSASIPQAVFRSSRMDTR
jgi:hypothetical protein